MRNLGQIVAGITTIGAILAPLITMAWIPNWWAVVTAIAGALLLVIVTGVIMVWHSKNNSGPTVRAVEFVREIFRAPYLLLSATMIGTLFGLLVLLVSAYTVSIDPPPYRTNHEASSPEPRSTSADGREAAAADAQQPVNAENELGSNENLVLDADRMASAEAAEMPDQIGTAESRQTASTADNKIATRSDNERTQRLIDKLPDALSGFLGGFVALLAVAVFYRRLAPYTDLWELIAEIKNDIERLSGTNEKAREIWWSYPGFALGRFRTLDDNGEDNSEAELFENFKGTLAKVFCASNVRVNALVYDEDCLEAFYLAYNYQVHCQKKSVSFQLGDQKFRSAADPEKVDLLKVANELKSTAKIPRINESLRAENELINVATQLSDSNTKIYRAESPEVMPSFVIVIGDVVYELANYGAPIHVPEDGSQLPAPFSNISGLFLPADGTADRHLLQLVAFRRHDATFAKEVKDHLSRHVHALSSVGTKVLTKSSSTPPSSSPTSATPQTSSAQSTSSKP